MKFGQCERHSGQFCCCAWAAWQNGTRGVLSFISCQGDLALERSESKKNGSLLIFISLTFGIKSVRLCCVWFQCGHRK